MASSIISSSKYFNRLEVNRLEVNNLKVNEEKQTKPSWLFSLIGDATYSASTNILTLVNNEKLQLLAFTDRPYRKQFKIDDPISTLNFLFNKDNSIDSFSEDPPNAVLVINNKQVVYELDHFNENTSTFHLKPLPNHSEYYNHTDDYTGEISLFIDNFFHKIGHAFKSVGNVVKNVVNNLPPAQLLNLAEKGYESVADLASRALQNLPGIKQIFENFPAFREVFEATLETAIEVSEKEPVK